MCKFGIILTLRYLVQDMALPSGISALTMWTLLAAVLILSFVNVICATNGKRMDLLVEMRIKGLLSTMIYRKVSNFDVQIRIGMCFIG